MKNVVWGLIAIAVAGCGVSLHARGLHVDARAILNLPAVEVHEHPSARVAYVNVPAAPHPELGSLPETEVADGTPDETASTVFTEGGSTPGDPWHATTSTQHPSVEVEAEVVVEQQHRSILTLEDLGGSAGARNLQGGTARLTALIAPGLDVDGRRLSIADLQRLAELSIPSSLGTRIDSEVGLRVEIDTTHRVISTEGGTTDVVLRMQADEEPARVRSPLRIHLVLDRSSSMQSNWQQVLQAARGLLADLQPEDELHIVAYGTRGEESFLLQRVGDGVAARVALDGITVGGGTNIEAGLRLAYRAAELARRREARRSLVILISDGVPSDGAMGSTELSGLADEARTEHGCVTTVVGLGHQFDARLLRELSRAGGGGYHVAMRASQLSGPLRAELTMLDRVVVQDVELRLDLASGVSAESLIAGDVDATLGGGNVRVSIPLLRPGEERRMVVRVAVAPGTEPTLGTVRVALARREVVEPISLEIARGQRDEARRELAPLWIALNARLGHVLELVGEAIESGQREQAIQVLTAHREYVERHDAATRYREIQHHADVVGRLTRVVDVLLPTANHTERRQVARALSGVAVTLGR